MRSVLWEVSWDGCKTLHVARSAGAGESKLGVGWNICQPPKAGTELFLIIRAETFPNKPHRWLKRAAEQLSATLCVKIFTEWREDVSFVGVWRMRLLML